MGALTAGTEVTRELVLLRRLGAGGMGSVWLAQHRKLEAEVVIKFLAESLITSDDARARFAREARATVKARSPHVVQLLDHGVTDDGIPFLVMELLEGSDLAKRMREQPLRPDEVQHVVDGVAQALDGAHKRGVVHRDVKPANVFLCATNPRPFVKLLDFGVAKRAEDVTLTATNALVGTPAYMSPEQMRGDKDIDHRSDLWALGVLVFHTLTGELPFRGDSIATIRESIHSSDRKRIAELRSDLPQELDRWMDRALATDPAMRFDSALAMADALAEALGKLAGTSRERGARPPAIPEDLVATQTQAQTVPTAPTALAKTALVASAAAVVVVIASAPRIAASFRHEEPPLVPDAIAATAPPAPDHSTTSTAGRFLGASPEPPAAPSASVTTRARRASPATSAPRTAPSLRIRAKRGPNDDEDVGF